MAHAARVLSDDSPAAPAVRLAVEQGRVTVSDASRVMDEPAEVQLRALERVTGGGSRNLDGAAQGLPPRGGLRWWPRLSAVLGRPHGGSGKRLPIKRTFWDPSPMGAPVSFAQGVDSAQGA